jgi:hypothetical protein
VYALFTDELVGACNMHGQMRNAYRIVVGTPEGKRPHSGPRCRWEDNIRMYVMEIEWECVGCCYLTQVWDQYLAHVNKMTNFQVPLKAWNFLTS